MNTLKKIVITIAKIIIYFFAVIFIIIALPLLFAEGGNILTGLICVGFGILMLPIVYKKITKFLDKKSIKLPKVTFLVIYSIVVIFGYAISFGIMVDGISKEQKKIEDMTKLNVQYSINEDSTTEENLEIKLNYENLEKLEINGNKIDISENNATYNFPLAMGKNKIIIVGTNGDIRREYVKNIERFTEEELQEKLKKEEEERIRLEEEERQRIEKEEKFKQQMEELEKQEQIEMAEKKEKRTNIIKEHRYIYQVENRLAKEKFKQINSGISEAPDGSTQVYYEYEGEDDLYIIQIFLQYSYASNNFYYSVTVK